VALASEALMVAFAEPTIAARASGEGPAAIAVLRLSGAEALVIARQCLPDLPAEVEARRLYLTTFRDGVGEPLDEVLAVHFRGPQSYTGEDVVEIHAHGGPALVAAIERCLIERGARAAAPGEFTRRAVQHGRMDLIDVEALAALLSAQSEGDLALARLASGEGAAEMRALVVRAVAALAEARGAEDHPLETEGEATHWRELCGDLAARCDRLVAGPSMEMRLHEGHRVVLLGPVNAGKSSLFNALLGTPRALVHEQPGTTRDAVSATISLGGKKITLYDTAGIREATGLERQGMELGLEAARGADLVIWVQEMGSAAPDPAPGVSIGVRVQSKEDVPGSSSTHSAAHGDVRVSAVTGKGLDELRTRILECLGPAGSARSSRQQRILRAAGQALHEATEGPDDWAVAALERAVASLRELANSAGSGLPELSELDAEIYRRFCIGK
jgi:tRNA modification GTPase